MCVSSGSSCESSHGCLNALIGSRSQNLDEAKRLRQKLTILLENSYISKNSKNEKNERTKKEKKKQSVRTARICNQHPLHASLRCVGPSQLIFSVCLHFGVSFVRLRAEKYKKERNVEKTKRINNRVAEFETSNCSIRSYISRAPILLFRCSRCSLIRCGYSFLTALFRTNVRLIYAYYAICGTQPQHQARYFLSPLQNEL